jgi:hypothetical protein
MTMKVNSLNYLQHFNEDIYSQFTNLKKMYVCLSELFTKPWIHLDF